MTEEQRKSAREYKRKQRLDPAFRQLEREANRRWKEKNPEKAKASFVRWKNANPERYVESIKRCHARNPEYHKAVHREKSIRRNREMKAAQCGQTIAYGGIYERDVGICQICQQRVEVDLENPDPMSGCMDHKTPISRGGLHSHENVQLAHLRCNSRKWSRTMEELCQPI